MVPTPTPKNSIRLFQLLGSCVYLHWAWFVMIAFEFEQGTGLIGQYTSKIWGLYELLAIFLIVTMHEFGHALACRSVGGRANQIILWPLGGVAYVDPPPRPGAVLWSIAAGPLVNVLLLAIMTGLGVAVRFGGWIPQDSNLWEFGQALWMINLYLLCFNMLPIFPLDGGQILQSLLWFWLGRAKSLLIASVLGMICGATGLVWLAIHAHNLWMMLIAGFVLLNCWNGMRVAKQLQVMERAPARPELACPNCQAHPLQGNFWRCARCQSSFDIFAARGVCPGCGTIYNEALCAQCGKTSGLYSYGQPPS